MNKLSIMAVLISTLFVSQMSHALTEADLCPDDLPAGAVCDSPAVVEPPVFPGVVNPESELCPDDLPAGAVCDSPAVVEPPVFPEVVNPESELCPDDLPAGAVCDSPTVVEPPLPLVESEVNCRKESYGIVCQDVAEPMVELYCELDKKRIGKRAVKKVTKFAKQLFADDDLLDEAIYEGVETTLKFKKKKVELSCLGFLILN